MLLGKENGGTDQVLWRLWIAASISNVHSGFQNASLKLLFLSSRSDSDMHTELEVESPGAVVALSWKMPSIAALQHFSFDWTLDWTLY